MFELSEGKEYSEANMRSKIELINLRRRLKEKEFKELAFGTSSNKYTWALLIETNDTKQLTDTIWDCYPIGSSTNTIQKDLDFTNYWSFLNKPLKQK